MMQLYLLSSLNIILVLCGDPPNIYRWMADNSYICGPNRDVDGSIVTFLSEDEGLACTACGTKRQKPPTEACGVRTKGKGKEDEEPRIGCFPIPQLCLDDYTLRYASAFPEEIKRAKEKAKAEGRGSVSEEQGVTEHIDNEFPSQVLDTNRLSKSKPSEKLDRENSVDNEPVIAITSTVITHATTNPLVGKEFEPRKFTASFATTTKIPANTIETNLQDITALETPLTTTIIPVPIKTTELHTEPTTTKVPLILPTLVNLVSGTPSIETHKTSATQMQPLHASTTTSPPALDKGESEFPPEELEEDVRKILMQKRREVRDADKCVSTGINCTLPTTTTRSTTTTTPTTLISLLPLSRQTAASTSTTTTTVTFFGIPEYIFRARENLGLQRKLRTRPFTPPLNGFKRTQSTPKGETTPPTTTVTKKFV
ncbi:hypothetical protein NECAME_07283 [Necator americanus]|uniref:Uncharacterized protein n=1 Tax=Necator americanus TaxID=51031 RepID=W2TPH6_NECAM|nr:hypothetical protein NECAME_07283 [Necator americanus]ETN83678.1 hypothetical protein NECAME_07283 [Necator americanus]